MTSTCVIVEGSFQYDLAARRCRQQYCRQRTLLYPTIYLAIKVMELLGRVEVIKHSPMAESQVWTPRYLEEGCKLSVSLCLFAEPSKVLLFQFSYILLQQKQGCSSELRVQRNEIKPKQYFLSICGKSQSQMIPNTHGRTQGVFTQGPKPVFKQPRP